MLETVDLRRLQVLRMVDEYGTVTAAAAAMHLTPSAVSHQLRQLSREVGVALLEREGRGVKLTAAGHRLVAHADALHTRWEQAKADLTAEADGRTGRLRVCGFATAVAKVLAPAAAQLAVTDPRLELQIREVDEAADGFDLLLAGETDIALAASATQNPPLTDPRFDQQPLLAEPLDLVVPADHHAAGQESVLLSVVAHEPWILSAPGSSDCYGLTASACAAAGFTPRVVHEVKSPVAEGALVARGLGVALLPRLSAMACSDVVRIPLKGDPPPQRHILTCVRRGSDRQPGIARGLQILREVADEVYPSSLPLSTPAGTATPGRRGGA